VNVLLLFLKLSKIDSIQNVKSRQGPPVKRTVKRQLHWRTRNYVSLWTGGMFASLTRKLKTNRSEASGSSQKAMLFDNYQFSVLHPADLLIMLKNILPRISQGGHCPPVK
jgi:hypothetical protein